MSGLQSSVKVPGISDLIDAAPIAPQQVILQIGFQKPADAGVVGPGSGDASENLGHERELGARRAKGHDIYVLKSRVKPAFDLWLFFRRDQCEYAVAGGVEESERIVDDAHGNDENPDTGSKL